MSCWFADSVWGAGVLGGNRGPVLVFPKALSKTRRTCSERVCREPVFDLSPSALFLFLDGRELACGSNYMHTTRINKLGKSKGIELLPAFLVLLLAVHTSGYQHRCGVKFHTHVQTRTASASTAGRRGSWGCQQHLHSLCGGGIEPNALSQRWFRSKSCRHRAAVGMGASSSSQQKTALIEGGGGSSGGYGAAAVSPLGAAPSSTDGSDPEYPRTGALGSLGVCFVPLGTTLFFIFPAYTGEAE